MNIFRYSLDPFKAYEYIRSTDFTPIEYIQKFICRGKQYSLHLDRLLGQLDERKRRVQIKIVRYILAHPNGGYCCTCTAIDAANGWVVNSEFN